MIKHITMFFAFLASLFMGTAHAALPANVTTAINDVGTDLATAAGLVITAMVAFWGLRKLGQKMGWW
uniref:Capsid protein G8P n=1 Tax=Dulem virus 61 TaxID=3145772 RepID=A0AAU8BAN9_9VIRU